MGPVSDAAAVVGGVGEARAVVVWPAVSGQSWNSSGERRLVSEHRTASLPLRGHHNEGTLLPMAKDRYIAELLLLCVLRPV
jgi:hypothetical protein